MNKLLTIIISCLFLNANAQSKIEITNTEKEIGTDLRTNSPIKAIETIFPEKIYHSYVDTRSGNLTIQLRGVNKNGKFKEMGDIMVYNLTDNQIKWSKRFYYNLTSYEQYGAVLIKKDQNKSYCLNPENGENLWEVKNYMNYYEPIHKIGIGYNSKTFGKSDRVEGIDLTNGKPLWEREIEVTYGWGEVFHLSDSVLMVVAAGLHSVNLHNGSGWDYKAETGKKKTGEAVAKNTAGIALGVLTGTYVFSYTDVVRNINSNVLIDSTHFYFASHNNIACLDRDGRETWSAPLPEEMTSHSTILIKDGILYLVNQGWANQNGKQITFGTPFLAAFDPKNGQQYFLSGISTDKEQVNGFIFVKDELLVIFKNRIAVFSLKDGSLIREKPFDMGTFQELKFFTGATVYLKQDQTFTSLINGDQANHYVYTQSGKTLEITNQLEIARQIEPNQLYIKYLSTKGYSFLSNKGETYIIDQNNRLVARLNISGEAILIGSKLYDIQEKSFIEVDLATLIQ